MSTRTDMNYGRRGGHWLPDGHEISTIDRLPLCEVCTKPMAGGQRRRHHLCNPDSMVGRQCTCVAGCTDELVGDGPTDCDPACVPCRIKRNVLHGDVVEWRRKR